MTTLGKIFVVTQFILSMAFAIVAGMFLAHRLPWNPPSPSPGATNTPGLIEQHDKRIRELAPARDRAETRWNAYQKLVLDLEAEAPFRQSLYTEKLLIAKTGQDSKKQPVATPVTVIEYGPLVPGLGLPNGRLTVVGQTPIQYRGQNLKAFDPIYAELTQLHLNANGQLGAIPETQEQIKAALLKYDTSTAEINGRGAVRGLRVEIALQEDAMRKAVEEQEYLKPFLANRYGENILVLQRQNAMLARKQELQKIGVAADK